jgi:hypothetical protein
VRATDKENVTLATHQLVGAAREWWENYQDAVDYPEDITWEEFMGEFRKYHIPEGVMEMKAEEFRYLRQGAMTVNQYIRKFMKLSRYAPEAVNSDKKKQICFRRGLNSVLRTQIISHVYPDFNTMMNRTILLEAELLKAEGEKKRKFNLQRARQQERTQRIRTNNAPRYQPTMQYRTPGSNSQQATPASRSYNTGKSKNNSNTTSASDQTCYGCRKPGHRIAQCPYINNSIALAPAPSAGSNRTAASGTGRAGPQNSGQQRRNTQNFGQGRVNHVSAEEVQAAPDVVYGEFLVNSASASVLFDSGASHSFVSACFTLKNKLRMMLLPTPLLIRTPGAVLKCSLKCPRVKIMINGIEFQADLVVLKTEGLDVILGMDWLRKHHGNISCRDRAVTVINHKGIKVECQPQAPKAQPMVCSIEAKTVEEVPVVCEYSDVFPEDLPGMPPDRDLKFIIDLIPGTAPIAKRPYRMAANELEELKKQLRELQEKGYIRPSSSPWGSPVLFLKKKDGSLRMCIDFHYLGSMICLIN